MAFENSKDLTLDRWMAVIEPGERIFILYLVSALALAFLSWLYYRRFDKEGRPEETDKGFWGYVFNKDVYFHKSAIQDYIYFFVNAVIFVGLIGQFLVSSHVFVVLTMTGLEKLFGMQEVPILQASVITLALYTLFYAVVYDLAVFGTHYLQHKVPILWEFHKVHHSAEVLNPVTLYRMHPVDLFFTAVVASILIGIGFGGYFYLTGEEPSAYEILGLNAILFVFYLLGYNLRHSQIWLHYPKWLSAIFVSPAQHQIHHSTQVKHWDKNMGLIFSFWDRMFGTLYVPEKFERLTYGISKKEPNPFKNVGDMYFLPFKNAWKILNHETDKKKALEKTITIAAVIAFCGLLYLAVFDTDVNLRTQSGPLPSVQIEDLTWTEVDRALHERGYDTIIIPTGGTEQNGPHLILGKHNYVVRHNAGEIAKRLGGTLVAPVITYVPEEQHMPYAGTASVSEELFGELLTAAAESYIRHGFKTVLFIGDSGGNQETQEKIAEALSRKYDSDDIKIFQIGDYYSANGQMAWLESQGFVMQEIGSHAGIRDTSEIKFIHPEGFRKRPWFIEDRDTGANGRADFASSGKGKKMTEMKIEAALKQIEKLTGKTAASDKQSGAYEVIVDP